MSLEARAPVSFHILPGLVDLALTLSEAIQHNPLNINDLRVNSI
jgi:hypothetical protein